MQARCAVENDVHGCKQVARSKRMRMVASKVRGRKMCMVASKLRDFFCENHYTKVFGVLSRNICGLLLHVTVLSVSVRFLFADLPMRDIGGDNNLDDKPL